MRVALRLSCPLFVLALLWPLCGAHAQSTCASVSVNCRTVVDFIAYNGTGVDTGLRGNAHAGPKYDRITVTCYTGPVSASVPCAGGGDFDRIASATSPCTGASDNGGTIIKDLAGDCFYRKNWGLNGVIDARQCGVAGDGSADDTAALNACLALAVADPTTSRPGYAIVSTGGGQVKINTGNVLIPAGVTLSCGGGSALGQVDNNDYTQVQHAIWLYNDSTGSPARQILGLVGSTSAPGAGVDGCVILRGAGTNGPPNYDYAPNFFVPSTVGSHTGLHESLQEVAHYAGTAIVANTESFSVTNTIILGFAQCWTNKDSASNVGKRVILDHVNCDGTAGFVIDGGGGGTQFDDLNVRSYLTGTGFVASKCSNCSDFNFENTDMSSANWTFIGLTNNGSNLYRAYIDTSRTPSVNGILPVTGDTVWIGTDTSNSQSAGGRWDNVTVASGTGDAFCGGHTCLRVDLTGSKYTDSSTNAWTATGSWATGSTVLNVDVGSIDIRKLAVGMNVGSTIAGCFATHAKIVALHPDASTSPHPVWNTVWISAPTAATCAGTSSSLLFWDDNAGVTYSNKQSATVSALVRANEAYKITGAAGVTFNSCHQSNHIIGFRASSGSGQTRFVNCVNENDHDLQDDAVEGLVCDTDCGGADWVNGILGQHGTSAIVVNTSSTKPVRVSNAGIGTGPGRQTGRNAQVELGILQLDNSAADTPGNIFVADGGHLTMSGVYVPNGTLYQQNATAVANTSGCGNTFAAPTPYACTTPVAAVPPGGRLTLTSYSATPPTGAVMTADVTSGSTLYYVPYVSQAVPIWNGAAYAPVDMGTSGLSFAMDASLHTTKHVYDIFAETGRTGALELCSGPVWTSAAVRASGISKANGIWTNSGSMDCVHSSAGGGTYTCPVSYCTYLGTMYVQTTGVATMQFGPKSATNGPALCVCLFNAYNRVPIAPEGHDTNAAYGNHSTAWRAMNSTHNGGLADGTTATNSITVVDGLGEVSVNTQLSDLVSTTTAGFPGQIGIDFNSTSATPLNIVASPATVAVTPLNASLRVPPSLGAWYVQPMESGGGTTVTNPQLGGAASQTFSISIDD